MPENSMYTCQHPDHRIGTRSFGEALIQINYCLRPEFFPMLLKPGKGDKLNYQHKALVLFDYLIGHYCPVCLVQGHQAFSAHIKSAQMKAETYLDMIVCSHAQFQCQLVLTDEMVRSAKATLAEHGLITNDQRTIEIDYRKRNNVQLLSLTPAAVARLQDLAASCPLNFSECG